MTERKQENIGKIEGNQSALPIIERDGKRLVVAMLTDLDGTVNDESVRESERITTIGPAKDAIAEFESRNIPVGIITARSFEEAVEYQTALHATGVIVCEDGAVIGLPLHAMDKQQEEEIARQYKLEMYKNRKVLLLTSIKTQNIKELLEEIEVKSGENQKIISSCTTDSDQLAIAAHHATVREASLSQGRLASAYAVGLSPAQLNLIEELAPQRNIRTFSSSVDKTTLFFGADTNKGHAVDVLRKNPHIFYPQSVKADGIFMITIGNHNNDAPLLSKADIAVVVAKPDGNYAISRENIPSGALVAKQAYGHGIKEAVPQILSRLMV